MIRRLKMFPAQTLAVPISLPVVAQGKPLLTKVDHFYLVSSESERLFMLFRDEFQLPVVWPYNSFGDFASGGLSFGNVALEFVSNNAADGAGALTGFKGIAFEPVGDADAAVAELKRRQLPHHEPIPFKFTQGGQELVGWVAINFTEVPPANVNIFICDYKQRERVAGGRDKAVNELVEKSGGPLGVISVRELVLGVASVKDASQVWDKLLDSPGRGACGLFAFGSGPAIRLVQAKTEGIQSMVVGVKSIARAKQFLAERRMLGQESNGQLWIDPAAVGGLAIALVED